ncbi:fimbrial protein [Pseudomonas chlororaphis]|uniref:Fimbrial subunit CupC1 n=1 Tax=Pseudomonas chlororaphis TaxID=587753 RepID=A0AAX3FWE0_9PSED|nr:fimbrial protein [Pseudomonas chlororaphis]AZC40065.1 Fimbrial protein precursor [Pseudomonas chlororaphis subsp. piscium]AZC46622.1 Fimbrial protein precursor [Pseudomonas chlororaphis subsp. piscium]WDG72117.1 fimbrial protein [Pseudomonas chlororaphis]WDH30098.1 fimbrial protein [Pseudomonas chlororaphis]WDH70638.1 fimbrial protein [Pseudomonas chlororaphis]
MSKLLKSIVSMAIAGAVSTSALAADGTINFTGDIIAASCKIAPGAGTSGSSSAIDVSLGKVSSESLGNTVGGSIVGGKSINLNLDCGGTAEGLKSVKLQFDPSSGSGIDSGNVSLLKIAGGTGAAEGVGIGLYNSSNKLVNLGANETIDGDLVPTTAEGKTTYTAKLNMRAGYVANGAEIKAGKANGTLPFTLSYE